MLGIIMGVSMATNWTDLDKFEFSTFLTRADRTADMRVFIAV